MKYKLKTCNDLHQHATLLGFFFSHGSVSCSCFSCSCRGFNVILFLLQVKNMFALSDSMMQLRMKLSWQRSVVLQMKNIQELQEKGHNLMLSFLGYFIII